MEAEKDPDSIRSELRRFGETVSVRGVSHIFKSPGRFVKVCWLLAVLISCTLLVWQLSAVFLKYFSFQITSTLEEIQDFPTFPDVSVCNLNAMTAYKDALTLSWDEFNEKVYDIASNTSLKELEMMYGDLLGNKSIDDLRNDLFFDLAAPTSYYSNFPMSGINQSASDKTLIVNRNYFGWDWNVLLGRNGESLSKITSVFNSNYFRCYTLRLSDRDYAKKIQALNIVLYINNFVHAIDFFYDRFSPSMILSRSTGVRIVVHSPGTNPLMRKGLSVGPGTEATIKVNSAVRTRLHYPYGDADCTDQTYLPFSDTNLYNFDNCNSVCLQQQYIDACHCLHPYQKYTDRQQRRTNSRICGNLSLIAEPNVSRALRELNCVQNLSVDQGICTRMCLLPCRENYYDYNGNSAPWPQLSQHMSFYYTYIDGRQHIYGNKFAEYGKIKWDEDPETMVERLKVLHLIEDNFLLINVVMQSQFVYMLTDKAQMTWDGVLSSIGGCLSLWLGVTVMTLVEIAEFLFRIGSIYFAKRKHKERTEPTGTAGAGKQIGEFGEFELRVIQTWVWYMSMGRMGNLVWWCIYFGYNMFGRPEFFFGSSSWNFCHDPALASWQNIVRFWYVIYVWNFVFDLCWH